MRDVRQLSGHSATLVLSYRGIRRAIGVIGLLLPVVLGPAGYLAGIPIQENISSYYYTPLRDVFVGAMCGIGIFLFCYRGYDWVENWTANLGCVSAIGVGLLPLDPNSDPLHQRTLVGFLHTAFGCVFFLTLAFYSLYHFPRHADDEEAAKHRFERNLIYRLSGVSILLSMLTMGAFLFLLPRAWQMWLNQFNFLFWMECVAVWAFAAAWLTKGRVVLAEIAVEMLAITNRTASKFGLGLGEGGGSAAISHEDGSR